jgi:hypothetical protein
LNYLELKYEELEKEFLMESSAADSLGLIVLKRAAAIDAEKKKNDPDEDKIIELMSGSASLSNELEKHRKKSKRLENNLEEIKQLLYKKYTVIIDSLQAAKEGGRGNGELQQEIFFYTERRLMVSPKIPMLSFNPQKVLKIDLGRIKEPAERKLFEDYLNNAFSEVNNLLVSVENESSELGHIAELEKRTKRFVEDTEFESGVIPRSISREGSQNSQTETETFNHGRGDNAVSNAENVKAYNSLLNQLNTGNLPAQGYNMRGSAAEFVNMDTEDYQKLLKEVKIRLQELKLVLANKISFNK